MIRIYLSGKMSGLPDNNYPAFNAEAARLRAMGYWVENPAENPAPPCGTWAGYMRTAVRQMLVCDQVASLPGWKRSRGALIEHWIATAFGMPSVPCEEITRNDPQ